MITFDMSVLDRFSVLFRLDSIASFKPDMQQSRHIPESEMVRTNLATVDRLLAIQGSAGHGEE